MTLELLKKRIEFDYYFGDAISFIITQAIYEEPDGRKTYNQIIRAQVPLSNYGVYIWTLPCTGEVVYVGVAGKIKNNGGYGDHCLQRRLTAARDRDRETKKDIQTNDYVKMKMIKHNWDALEIHVFYSRQSEPPSYAEALVLYHVYKQDRCLPILNNTF